MNFQHQIEVWYAAHCRELPWRNISDPYRIWISEIILQQTRIAQGEAYYRRFIERFPTVEALACAEDDEVMRLWQGLGYYSRARNLHAAARDVAMRGSFPNTYEEIRRLRGVGDYTAAAIASFAFGLPHAVVDGNVYRVLSRYFAIRTPIDSGAGHREFARLADELLDRKRPGLYNQALMDFGALQCVPHAPKCTECPLIDSCEAYATGAVEELPIKAKRTAVKHRYLTYFLLTDGTSILMHRRTAGDIWAGLYEPFLLETTAPLNALQAATALRKALPGTTTDSLRLVADNVKHILTHRILHATLYEVATKRLPVTNDYLPISRSQIGEIPVSRLVDILLKRYFGE